MRINADTTITGERVVLVPYRKEHVQHYHEWMLDPELQEATASEPLTLEQEHEMQASWALDEDKLTFIVLDRSMPDTPGTGSHGGGMAGDVNLFFNDPDEASVAEIEVMIAERSAQRRGLASEALLLLMAYAVTRLGVTRFVAKIGEDNAPSLSLFRSRLGYCDVSRSEVFKELTLVLDAAAVEVRDRLRELGERLVLGTYDGAEGSAAAAPVADG